MNSPAQLTSSERALTWMLRFNGLITLLALPAVFMPMEWMDKTHRFLGMGAMPRGPVVEYLARTVSALYAFHGGLCLLLARDVRRFGPIISYVAVVALCFAALVFWIDHHARLPRSWMWSESGTVAVMSGIILFLRLKSRRTT